MKNYTSETASLIGKRPLDIRNHTETILITVDNKLEDGYSKKLSSNRVAKDSGGFKFLMEPEKAEDFDVNTLVESHRRIGLNDNDIIIAADFPIPRFANLTDEEVINRQQTSCDWYTEMKEVIPQTIPVIHGRNAKEILYHLNNYNTDGMVGFGSNLAQSTHRVMSRIGAAKTDSTKPLVSKSDLWQVIIEASEELLQQDRKFFLLGAGGMNAAKIATMLGAECVDATSWRLNAMTRRLMDAEHGRFIKVGRDSTLHKEWADSHLRKAHQEDDHPFGYAKGYAFDEMIALLSADGAEATTARGLHNIWELDRDAKELSEMADDPDRLKQHILNQWQGTGYHHSLNKKILAQAYDIRKGASPADEFINFHALDSTIVA
tara:strand:- start:6858 stop:7988 length:1131 start_codon:yes stop_codon:yes gene_type:complete